MYYVVWLYFFVGNFAYGLDRWRKIANVLGGTRRLNEPRTTYLEGCLEMSLENAPKYYNYKH